MQCGCKNIGVVTKEEFLRGMKALKVASLTELKQRLRAPSRYGKFAAY